MHLAEATPASLVRSVAPSPAGAGLSECTPSLHSHSPFSAYCCPKHSARPESSGAGLQEEMEPTGPGILNSLHRHSVTRHSFTDSDPGLRAEAEKIESNCFWLVVGETGGHRASLLLGTESLLGSINML